MYQTSDLCFSDLWRYVNFLKNISYVFISGAHDEMIQFPMERIHLARDKLKLM